MKHDGMDGPDLGRCFLIGRGPIDRTYDQQLMCPSRSIRLASLPCLVAAVLTTGCADPGKVSSFESNDPAARIRAIREAVRTSDQTAVPHLITSLYSDDPAERLLAIRGLERLIGRADPMGYDHAAPPWKRDAAADRWAAWYAAGMPEVQADSIASGQPEVQAPQVGNP